MRILQPCLPGDESAGALVEHGIKTRRIVKQACD
jgi:hypothetical protein